MAAADHPRWFVQQKNAWLWGSMKGAPIHFNLIFVEISLVADRCQLSIHFYPMLTQEVFGSAP